MTSPQDIARLVGHTPSPQHKRDVVEQLREASLEDGQSSWMWPSPPWAERSLLLSDAADEIERLRKLIEAMQAGKT